MVNEDTPRRRDATLDLVKYVSCIFIVILHSPAIAQGSVFVIIQSITSVAVPAFIAVIGTIFIVRTVGDDYFNFGLQLLQLNVVMATTGYIAVCLWISETIQRTRFSNFPQLRNSKHSFCCATSQDL